ncbi:TonB-dependent receptor [Sphingomonas sp. A2-49]|uniref:TonB-dependent receptor n=1 Tax=Sphingomonas sp. A2-49 TaxID=1391375 RepID=UPI0021D120F1|nr:TonB-dependent receptor [Sphingomonas sp. A2-49]MCU6453518.1 TonB-dependent receptor [Sphingomonas sp. A2-49]
MRKFELLAASALVMLPAIPAAAQTGDTTSARSTAPTNAPGQDAPGTPATTDTQGNIGDIVITAQRQSQRLQDVPIAVSAFTAETLEKQQIVNPAALQQSLPNITFTKTNFTSSSFTIRGIGDLCVGVTCDQATAIHVNDMPVQNTRLFESEFFDLERIEVLRGPQGTLFGRNATSGVANFITAKPDLGGIRAAGEVEYGNYDSKRARAMLNLPLGDTLGVRVAGTYLKRDGYTRNLYDNSRIDDRDLYSVRGTLSWEPSSDTRIDLIGYYFREKDHRSRIQKQLCHRDPTGVLGCLPDTLRNETTNGNSTLSSIQSSNEFLTIASAAAGGILGRFGLGSVYGADVFTGVANPRDVRTVNVDFTPTYFADEEQYTAKIFHDFGAVSLNVTGGYQRSAVVSRVDYTLAVENPLTGNAGLAQLNALGRAGSPFAFLNTVRQTLIPNGPAGGVCQSDSDPSNTGIYGGHTIGCFAQSIDFDESSQRSHQYSVEAHLDSKFDGMFNFLLGGIYYDSTVNNNSYYVNSFGLDYASGLLGALASGGTAYFGSPYYRSNTDYYRLTSYGAFGETYFAFNDTLKLTLGLRYNHDQKFARARTTYLVDANGNNPYTPYGATSLSDSRNYNGSFVNPVTGATVPQLDYDATLAGAQPFQETAVSFGRLTGRAVLDYRITRDNLIYASYSRGYKSGGINPPLSPVFSVPSTFAPETVDSFEVGSKNTFGNGTLRLNLTGFYYRYKGLQLSRIVARTAVNDNVDAHIYGVEAEAIISPTPALVANINFSYLKTEVANDKFLANPRDPSGGRSDAVIIKDITNASNCAVVPTTAGNVAGVNTLVGAFNSGAGLRAPTAIPGTTTTGAFSICGTPGGTSASLTSLIANPPATLRALFATPTGPLPFTVLGSGVAVNIAGNRLPQAPTFKASVGMQYTLDMGASGWTVVPRADLNYTGNSYGSIFNGNIDRIPGYEVVNAQVQVNAPGDRLYVRAFVQNLTRNDAVTGQYVTDQSSGLFTNIFTIEPRRYGLAAGFRF